MSGAKIIEGLKDAVAGNFASVTIEGQRWIRADVPPSAATSAEPVALAMVRRLVHEFEPGHYHNCPADHKDADPNSCVCFGGHLIREAKGLMATPTPVVADRAQSSSPEIPDSSPNCSKSSNGSPEPDAVRERLAKALRESALHKSYWSVDDKDLAMRAATALCPLSRPQGEGGGAKDSSLSRKERDTP